MSPYCLRCPPPPPPPAPPNTQQVILITAEKPLFLRRSLPHSHLHFSLSWLFSVSFNSSCHTCYSLAFFLPSCISPHCVFSPLSSPQWHREAHLNAQPVMSSLPAALGNFLKCRLSIYFTGIKKKVQSSFFFSNTIS